MMGKDKFENPAYYSTDEYAAFMRIKSDSIRRALCINGHYLGVKPLKLPNKRLLWPAEEVRKILEGDMNE